MNNENTWNTGKCYLESQDYMGNISQSVLPSRKYERNFLVSGFGPSDYKHASVGSFQKEWIVGPTGFESQSDSSTSPFHTYTRYSGDMRVHWGAPPDPGSWTSDANTRNDCITKLYDAIHRGLNGSLGVDVGEAVHGGLDAGARISSLASSLRNPINTIGHLCNDLGAAAHKFSKGNKSKRAVKALNNAYLNFTYGLGPAAADVYDVLRDKVPPLATSITTTARKTTKRVDSDVFNDFTWHGFKRSAVNEMSLRYLMQVTYYISDPSLFNLSRLTSLNPVYYWWQLTKLSFVVDWLYDVSGFLSNLESSLGLGLSFERGFTTITSRAEGRSVYAGTFVSGSFSRQANGTGYRVRSTKSRSALVSFPMPSIPSFKKPFNFGSRRLANAASLVAGASSVFNQYRRRST